MFDKLWNYNDPAGTEAKFKALLRDAERSDDRSYLAQLLTQIARAQGLQGKFEDAHATLDQASAMLANDMQLARVRYLLERGRVFNSSDQPDKALPLFNQAYELASSIGENRYAIDAAHMIAIAERTPGRQIEWNLKGIAMCEADPNQRRWLWSLYNNIAESYAAAQDYKSALKYVRKLLDFQKQNGQEADMYTLKDEARMLRLLGHPEQSLAIIQPIYQNLVEQRKDDGWIREELAESLLAMGKNSESNPHFARAHELLSNDPWCITKEQPKLKRLKNMAALDGQK